MRNFLFKIYEEMDVKWRARYDHISLYRSVKFLVIKKIKRI